MHSRQPSPQSALCSAGGLGAAERSHALPHALPCAAVSVVVRGSARRHTRLGSSMITVCMCCQGSSRMCCTVALHARPHALPPRQPSASPLLHPH